MRFRSKNFKSADWTEIFWVRPKFPGVRFKEMWLNCSVAVHRLNVELSRYQTKYRPVSFEVRNSQSSKKKKNSFFLLPLFFLAVFTPRSPIGLFVSWISLLHHKPVLQSCPVAKGKYSGGPLDNQTWQTEWNAPLVIVRLSEYVNQIWKLLLRPAICQVWLSSDLIVYCAWLWNWLLTWIILGWVTTFKQKPLYRSYYFPYFKQIFTILFYQIYTILHTIFLWALILNFADFCSETEWVCFASQEVEGLALSPGEEAAPWLVSFIECSLKLVFLGGEI